MNIINTKYQKHKYIIYYYSISDRDFKSGRCIYKEADDEDDDDDVNNTYKDIVGLNRNITNPGHASYRILHCSYYIHIYMYIYTHIIFIYIYIINKPTCILLNKMIP